MDNYKQAIIKALDLDDVTICVGDTSIDYNDLDHSTSFDPIVEAIEATESPVLKFYQDGKYKGSMLVLVGYGDESIVDHHCNDFMDLITKL